MTDMNLTARKLPEVPGVAAGHGWNFGISVEASWSDIDKLGHVTNSAYWRWCDDARVQYIMSVGFDEPDPTRPSFVVLSAQAQYSATMRYREQGLMTCRTRSIGNSSLEMEHALWLRGGLSFSASFKLVLVDQATGKSMRIPENGRREIGNLDHADFS